MGFRVSGFGFRVSGLGFRVWDLGFRFEGSGERRRAFCGERRRASRGERRRPSRHLCREFIFKTLMIHKLGSGQFTKKTCSDLIETIGAIGSLMKFIDCVCIRIINLFMRDGICLKEIGDFLLHNQRQRRTYPTHCVTHCTPCRPLCSQLMH